jgi:hypothetical protein
MGTYRGGAEERGGAKPRWHGEWGGRRGVPTTDEELGEGAVEGRGRRVGEEGGGEGEWARAGLGAGGKEGLDGGAQGQGQRGPRRRAARVLAGRGDLAGRHWKKGTDAAHASVPSEGEAASSSSGGGLSSLLVSLLASVGDQRRGGFWVGGEKGGGNAR